MSNTRRLPRQPELLFIQMMFSVKNVTSLTLFQGSLVEHRAQPRLHGPGSLRTLSGWTEQPPRVCLLLVDPSRSCAASTVDEKKESVFCMKSFITGRSVLVALQTSEFIFIGGDSSREAEIYWCLFEALVKKSLVQCVTLCIHVVNLNPHEVESRAGDFSVLCTTTSASSRDHVVMTTAVCCGLLQS